MKFLNLNWEIRYTNKYEKTRKLRKKQQKTNPTIAKLLSKSTISSCLKPDYLSLSTKNHHAAWKS